MVSSAYTPSITKMRHAIIANPASGRMTIDEKRSALATAAAILNAEIYGLDTTTAWQLSQCAQELASRCDLLVVAGGDGTLSDVMNAVDTAQTPIAFLPLGTGNAMQKALTYKGNLADIALRIRDGHIRQYDLINCDGKIRAFMASVGIEGAVIALRDQYLTQGARGFRAYGRAVFGAYFKEYRRTNATINEDGTVFEVQKLLSLMVTKQPYYGFGMHVVPKARFDDGNLHILCITAGLFKSLLGGVTAFTIGNRIGRYSTGRRVTAELDRPLVLQVDGNAGWAAERFTFTVIPKALKLKC